MDKITRDLLDSLYTAQTAAQRLGIGKRSFMGRVERRRAEGIQVGWQPPGDSTGQMLFDDHDLSLLERRRPGVKKIGLQSY